MTPLSINHGVSTLYFIERNNATIVTTIVLRLVIVVFIKLIIANAIRATAPAEMPSEKDFMVDGPKF